MAALVLTGPGSAFAAGGTLDATFGTNGVAEMGVSSNAAANLRFFVDSAGAPVVADLGGTFQWDADGKTASTSTGISGITFQTDAAMDSSNRVVIIGNNQNQNMNVVRYANGALDSTFGSGGIVNFPTINADSGKVFTFPDGSVLVWAGGQMIKLTPTGTLDTTWDPSGTTPGMEPFTDGAYEAGFQSDGHIVITCNMNWQQNDPCIERLNADGTLDSTFGVNGKAPGFAAEGLGQTDIGIAAMNNDNSFYAVGVDFTHSKAVIARYTATGSPDPTFGNNGVSVDPTTYTNDVVQFGNAVLGSDGIYVSEISQNHAPQIVRYTTTGSRDPSFAHNAALTSPGTIIGYGLAPSGKLLIATGSLDVYRYLVTGVDPVAGFSGVANTSGAALSWTNPATPSFDGVSVRYAAGTTPPATPTSGVAVYSGTGQSASLGLPSGENYAVSAFVTDFSGNASTAATCVLYGTKTTASAPKTIVYGATTTVSATLKTIAGSALAGRSLLVYARPVGTSTWTHVASLTTSSTGVVSYAAKPSRSENYEFMFGGSLNMLHSLATTTVTVAPHLTARWSAVTFSHLTGTTVSGTLSPRGVVYLQRVSAGRWVTAGTYTIPSGTTSYHFTVKPVVGYWTFRIYVPASGGRVATASTAVRLHSV